MTSTPASLKIEPERLYTPREAADILRCSRTNVYSLMHAGELAVTRIGAVKGFRFLGSDITAFVDSRKSGGPQPKMHFKNLGLSSP